MTTYAQTGTKRGPMHDAAIVAQVTRMLSTIAQGAVPTHLATPVDVAALIEAKCGRYTRGAHKGAPRGWATWTFVVKGGWLKDGPGHLNGHVVRPGQVIDVVVTDFGGKTLLAGEHAAGAARTASAQHTRDVVLPQLDREFAEAFPEITDANRAEAFSWYSRRLEELQAGAQS